MNLVDYMARYRSHNDVAQLVKNQIKNNMRGAFRNARTKWIDPNPGLGKLFAELNKGDRREANNRLAYMDLVNELNGMETDTRMKVYRKLQNLASDVGVELEAEVCDDCSDLVHESDTCHSSRNDCTLCQHCASENWRYSEIMGDYIPEDDAYEFYEYASDYNRGTADYVTSSFAQRRDYMEDNDGRYFTNDAYYEIYGDSDSDDYDGGGDEDSSDGDEYNRANLPEWHRGYREFNEVNSTPLLAPSLGVELEVYANGTRDDVVFSIRDIYDSKTLFLEKDGSIDSDQGFEIITQPFGVTEWPELAKNLLELLKENDTVGYTTPKDGDQYGIHVNLHRRHLTAMQETRISQFMTSWVNRDFVIALAQRQLIYGSGATQPGSISSHRVVNHTGGVDMYTKKPRGLGKYAPLHLHDELAEFRLFQSTTHLPSFMKNLELVWALVKWTGASTGTSFHHRDFCSWLASRGSSEVDYPHLLAFLRKPSFMGKGYYNKIPNTWNHLLPKQTTKSLSIVTGEIDLRLAA